jgi:hypothetical protein
LSSPVAAVFLALTAVVGGVAAGRGRRVVALSLGAILPLAVLGLLFPEGGEFPFWFSAYWPLALFCGLALLAIRGLDRDRDVRAVLAVYLALATLDWLVPSPFGGNITRLGALFGGPVLLAVLFSRAPQRVRTPLAVAALVMGLAWQVVSPFRQVTESLDDPSTSRSYYRPVKAWLAAHGAQGDRIEIPQTFNHWEAAYVAPDFSIARGWLRQLDRERNEIFYDGREPTHARYRRWLHDNGVRWVAASDARLDYSAVDEDRLVREDPPYLRLRARLAHWRVYEVAGAGVVADHRTTLEPESFTLNDVAVPGRFAVKVRWSPYWHVEEGSACVGKAGDWTVVRVDEPGPVRVTMRFTADAALHAALGRERRCR